MSNNLLFSINNQNQKPEVRIMNELTKQTAEKFQCNYTIFEQGTDPELVEEAYMKSFAAAKDGGYWPAILSLDEHASEWLNIISGETDRDQIISGCGDNGKEILQERFETYTDYMDEKELENFTGNETEGDRLHHFMGYISFRDKMLEADTLLLELPVKHPWEIIGYLPMGGWNECPDAEEMIAICKYWYEKYHAVPAAFTHDVMEFYAPDRLNGIDGIEAAKEHYAFCNDRIDQGTRTYKLSELAAGLADSDVWYFWWD